MEPVLIVLIVAWCFVLVGLYLICDGILTSIALGRIGAFTKYIETQIRGCDWSSYRIVVDASFDNFGRSSIFDQNFEKMVVRQWR